MLYIARQPIFDSDRKTQAYEVLFRETDENCYRGGDPDVASRNTLDTALLVGLDVLSAGHEIFLNCSQNLILGGYPSLFPPDVAVVEVLETVIPTPELVDACKQLKQAGYRIALDDFVGDAGWEGLIELADIIKVDFRLTTPEQRQKLVHQYLRNGRKMLAEKVETHEEFRQAAAFGYELFQGYFFCRPDMLSTSKLPRISDNCFRIFYALGNPELDLVQIEHLIKSEPALCYRLLRYLNSPAFCLQTEIRSILHALTLLGEQELRKWLLLVCTVIAGGARKPELVTAALIRARFAELLAPYASLDGSALFFVSLLSLFDAILGTPREQLMKQIAVPQHVYAAVMGEPNRLRRCHDLVVAYETGDWPICEALRQDFGIHPTHLRRAYLEALQWARRLNLDTSCARFC